jgi:hypothetical protein
MSATSSAAAETSSHAAELKAPPNLKVLPTATGSSVASRARGGCSAYRAIRLGRRCHFSSRQWPAHRLELRLQEEGAAQIPARAYRG